MTTWRESLGKVEFQDGRTLVGAKFRGVPFYVDDAERSGGRRTVKHEYPLRDEPFVEDMGRKARSFPLEGHVIGPDYLAQRDALLAALEESGPGTLYHPYYGTLSVICTEFRVRESSADGGMARFSLEFEETETLPAFPVATPAAAAQVATSAQAVVAGVRSQVTAQYNVSGPRAAIASLSAIVSSAAGSMKAALAPLVSTTQELAGLKRDTDALIHAADSLVRRPFDVLDGLTGALAALTSPATPTFIMGLLAAYGFLPTADRPAGSTATRIQDAVNWDVLLGVARTVPLVQAATLAPVASYDSYDAALAVRDAIAGAIDDLSDGAGDESFAALAQLRADLVQAVPGVESDLPRILRYTPPSTVPSLVLAHRLYGDLSREADLVTRNAIPRPGFILGGVELQVLSHA